jgi:hypothetical protein
VLNTRLTVLHSMLDMLRSQQVSLHSDQLEWIIIWLIVLDLCVLLVQLAATVLGGDNAPPVATWSMLGGMLEGMLPHIQD